MFQHKKKTQKRDEKKNEVERALRSLRLRKRGGERDVIKLSEILNIILPSDKDLQNIARRDFIVWSNNHCSKNRYK